MSETTSKLSLFKYNTTADAKQPFSIKDCMNDNWDKLDAFATSVDTIFSSSFSSNLDKKVFSDINKELGKKLEADVLLAENGYIKFNNRYILTYGGLASNVTFPIAYPTGVSAIVDGMCRNGSDSGTHFQFTHVNNTGFGHRFDGGQWGWYIAIGY